MTQKLALVLVLLFFLPRGFWRADNILFIGSSNGAANGNDGGVITQTRIAEKRLPAAQANDIPYPVQQRTPNSFFQLRGKRAWRTSTYLAPACCVSGVFVCQVAGTSIAGVDAGYIPDTRQTLLAKSGHSQLFQDI
jgi:hypothetical protein